MKQPEAEETGRGQERATEPVERLDPEPVDDDGGHRERGELECAPVDVEQREHLLPWLISLAAVGLALVMVSAILFHLARNEVGAGLSMNGPLLVLAVFVALGRYMIVPL